MTCRHCEPDHPDPDLIRSWLVREDAYYCSLGPLSKAYVRESGALGQVTVWAQSGEVVVGLLNGLGRNSRLRATAQAHAVITDPHSVSWERARAADSDDDEWAWVTPLRSDKREVDPVEVWSWDGSELES